MSCMATYFSNSAYVSVTLMCGAAGLNSLPTPAERLAWVRADFPMCKRSAQALAGDGRMEARQGRDEAVTRSLGSRQPSAKRPAKAFSANSP